MQTLLFEMCSGAAAEIILAEIQKKSK